MKSLLAVSAMTLALASGSPAAAQNSLIDQLSQYVPDSVISLLDRSEILDAFTMTRNSQSDRRATTRVEYLATSGAVPRTYSTHQLNSVGRYLTDAEMQNMSAQHFGDALAIIASSKPEAQKAAMIRSLSYR
ncbi:hypothetical protein [Salipiger sp. CCB-MM3]|uniref:hypothetical protein n=1 Tax=Salipiger sp. CCB-MM3 TaxID=1792508 RepID=UPI0012FBDABB|nr:hypothetical protein [Salipiger sp. CCB-MM3]